MAKKKSVAGKGKKKACKVKVTSVIYNVAFAVRSTSGVLFLNKRGTPKLFACESKAAEWMEKANPAMHQVVPVSIVGDA